MVNRNRLIGLAAFAIVMGGPLAAADPSGQAATAVTGPYPATMSVDPGLPTHPIYRPANIPAGVKLPIVAVGNGGCVAMGNMFAPFLLDVASHGYLVIAIGPPRDPDYLRKMMADAMKVRPGATAAPMTAAGAANPSQSLGKSIPALPPGLEMAPASRLTDALDWAISENRRRGSDYYHRLAVNQLAVMGQSCGGIQAMAVSSDPRVRTTVMLNSGLFAPGEGPPLSADSTALGRLYAPVLYLLGGPSDIAYKPVVANFPQIHVPVVMAETDVGHAGSFGPGGRFDPVVISWLDWQLKRKAEAAATFRGANCKLCKQPEWKVQTRNFR